MPISESHAGMTYPATSPFEVTRGKIAEFAAALGDTNPAYGGERPIAPPTFAAVLAAEAWGALFADPELGLQLKRTIHYDQRFAYRRPLRAGDILTAALTIDKVRLRGLTAFIAVSVRLADVDAQEVCTATSTLLHTWPAEEDAA